MCNARGKRGIITANSNRSHIFDIHRFAGKGNVQCGVIQQAGQFIVPAHILKRSQKLVGMIRLGGIAGASLAAPVYSPLQQQP
jgi:hypothetical protein